MDPQEEAEEAGTFGVPELMRLYAPVKARIEERLRQFRKIWEIASDEELFKELVFCLLTPQSRAKTCWNAVLRLERKSLVAEGEACQIQEELVGVRFHQRKAEYICLAREMFSQISLRATLAGFASPFAAREWLVKNVLGLGYKEASHFLRNIGRRDLAIIDFHIVDLLSSRGIIRKPESKSLGKKKYEEIEKKLAVLADRCGLCQGELDLYLWYMETGTILK